MTTGSVNTYGKGKAIIIGSYIGHNATAYRNEASGNFVKKLLSLAGISCPDYSGFNIRERYADDKKALVVFNPANETKTVSIPISNEYKYLDSYGGKISGNEDGLTITCEALDSLVVVLERCAKK